MKALITGSGGLIGSPETIRRRRISIHRTEVALAFDQRVTHGKGLSQPNQSIINGQVSVGMVLAHHVADDSGALARGPVGIQAHLLHGVQNAAVHRL